MTCANRREGLIRAARAAAAVCVCILLVALLAAPEASASWSYTDGDGVAHMTDRLENVPAEYRAEASQLRDETRTDGYVPGTGAAPSNSTLWAMKEQPKAEPDKKGPESGAGGMAGGMFSGSTRYVVGGVAALLLVAAMLFITAKSGAVKALMGLIVMAVIGTAGFVLISRLYVKTYASTGARIINDAEAVKKIADERVKRLNQAVEEFK